jgi:CHAT domain-containing protein
MKPQESVRSLLAQARSADARRDLATAERLLGQAESASEPLLLGECRLLQGVLAIRRDDLMTAQQRLDEAQRLLRETPLWRECQLWIGALQTSQRRFPEAEATLTSLLSLGPRDRLTGMVFARLGLLEESRGNPVGAETYYKEGIRLLEPLPDLSADETAPLRGLGLHSKTNPDERESLLFRCVQVTESKSPRSFDHVRALLNYGLFKVENDPNTGEDVYKQALSFVKNLPRYRTTKIAHALLLNNLANLWFNTNGKFEDIESSHLQAKAIREEVFGPQSGPVADSLNNLGNLYGEFGQYDRAAAIFQQAKARAQSAGDAVAVFRCTHNLSFLAYRMRNYPEALRLLDEAAGIATAAKLDVSLDLIRATVLNELGRSSEALTLAKAVAKQREDESRRVYLTENRVVAVQRLAGSWRLLGDTFLALGQREKAFEYFEKARSRIALEQLGDKAVLLDTKLDVVLREKRQRLDQAYAAASVEAVEAADSSKRSLPLKLLRLERERSALEGEIRKAYPDYARINYPEPATVADLKSLPEGALLITYQFGLEGGQILTATRAGASSLKTFPVPQLLRTLRSTVRTFRETLTSRNSYETLSRQLHDWLIAPIEDELKSAKLLVLCPDDALHLLPFAALKDRSGRFLGQRFPLVHIASLTALKAGGGPLKQELPPITLLALADPKLPPGKPTLSNTLALPSTPLPKNRAVAEVVAREAKGKAIVGAQATKKALLTYGPRARRIHLATHAKAFPDRPLASVLRLTSGEGEDGYLSALDLYAGKLTLSAELVVLAACETGVGRIRDYDGAQSLARAFQYAGARSVLSTLWPVEDPATAEFMKMFYQTLKSSSLIQAFHKTMLRASARPGSRHPYFWSGFQLHVAELS